MHEVSLVRSILKTLENQLEEKEMSQLSSIHLKVGPLSNVQPLLMQSAFDAVKKEETQYQDVNLMVEFTDIIVECPVCKSQSKVEQYKFVCAQCGNPTKYVISGDELLISKVEFQEK